MGKIGIEIPQKELEDFCRRNHIRKLSFFGSVLRATFTQDSDIDVLIEFEQGHVPGFGLIRMQDELSDILGGRRVDLVTPKFLNRHIRDKVQAEAVTRYVHG